MLKIFRKIAKPKTAQTRQTNRGRGQVPFNASALLLFCFTPMNNTVKLTFKVNFIVIKTLIKLLHRKNIPEQYRVQRDAFLHMRHSDFFLSACYPTQRN